MLRRWCHSPVDTCRAKRQLVHFIFLVDVKQSLSLKHLEMCVTCLSKWTCFWNSYSIYQCNIYSSSYIIHTRMYNASTKYYNKDTHQNKAFRGSWVCLRYKHWLSLRERSSPSAQTATQHQSRRGQMEQLPALLKPQPGEKKTDMSLCIRESSASSNFNTDPTELSLKYR